MGPFPTSQQGIFHSEETAGAKVKSLRCHNVFSKDKCYLGETVPGRPRLAHEGLAVSLRNTRDSGSLLGGLGMSGHQGSALMHGTGTAKGRSPSTVSSLRAESIL